MAHARQTIRQAVAALVTGLTTTGTRVFQGRMRPQDALPCLLVTTNDEDILQSGIGPEQQRDLRIEIVGVAKAAADVDDTLDTIAAEVETAIGFNNSLGGVVDGLQLVSLTTSFDDEFEQPVGQVRLVYRCTYFTNAGAPGTTL